ncbi:hypothetical protein JCGZ_18775 [Jatropha curcas]|uniref:Aminotransferase-like plant mobile domain-containing protein n=1 Tax=Jatropha curcas TaxID=180498 RepID=A0A067LE57_JATCU|nr:hypothetical protein JCGZ_18775 [Jatropha curcas]
MEFSQIRPKQHTSRSRVFSKLSEVAHLLNWSFPKAVRSGISLEVDFSISRLKWHISEAVLCGTSHFASPRLKGKPSKVEHYLLKATDRRKIAVEIIKTTLKQFALHQMPQLVQARTLPSSILALMERWMDSTHTFHLPLDEMTITPIDFDVITELPFGGRSSIATTITGSRCHQTQLLIHVAPPMEFDPFIEAKELDQGQGAVPVSIDDYNKVCQLYEAAGLKLAKARLSDEYIFFSHEDWDLLSPFELSELNYYRNIQVQSGLLQWLINHSDSSEKLFCHNDFMIYPLFEEFIIISGRIPVVEEIPAVAQVDIDPTSLILPVFGFSAYEILSYDFGANVVPLGPLVDRAMSMDHTSRF